jgi:hypothetical protein
MLLLPIWPLFEAPSRKNSVDGDGAVVERPLPYGRAVEGDAGHHGAEHERIARIERHLCDLLRGDDATAAGGLGFEHRGVRGDFDGVGDCADFQIHVDGYDLGCVELDGVFDVLLESLGRRGDLIDAGTEQRDRI